MPENKTEEKRYAYIVRCISYDHFFNVKKMFRVEVAKETDKTITLPHGKRYSKSGDTRKVFMSEEAAEASIRASAAKRVKICQEMLDKAVAFEKSLDEGEGIIVKIDDCEP